MNNLFVADAQTGLYHDCARLSCLPAYALCRHRENVWCAHEGEVAAYQRDGKKTMCFCTKSAARALVVNDAGVYCLFEDSDYVTRYSFAGDLLCCAPAGSYPRALCLGAAGQLACAGGAAGCVYLYDKALKVSGCVRLAGAVLASAFSPRALYALCAVGDGDMTTLLMRISMRGVAEEMLRLQGMPCALCACEDDSVILCTQYECLNTCMDKIRWRIPVQLPAKIRFVPPLVLLADQMEQKLIAFPKNAPKNQITLYQGAEPADMLIV